MIDDMHNASKVVDCVFFKVHIDTDISTFEHIKRPDILNSTVLCFDTNVVVPNAVAYMSDKQMDDEFELIISHFTKG